MLGGPRDKGARYVQPVKERATLRVQLIVIAVYEREADRAHALPHAQVFLERQAEWTAFDMTRKVAEHARDVVRFVTDQRRRDAPVAKTCLVSPASS